MKIKCICLTVIASCCILFSFAQKDNSKGVVYGYKLANNNIIFSYTVPLNKKIDSVKSITIAGSFNNWNAADRGYKLTSKDNRIFVLTLPESSFEKDRLYTFKFVINGDTWLDAPDSALNIDGSHYNNLTFAIDTNSVVKSDSVAIIPNYDKITSVSELLDVCKGQSVFIDYWATWCSPCIEAFKHSDTLHAFLKKKGIKIIYVCSNYNTDDSTWRNTIAAYKLAGYHIRAGKYLEEDLNLILHGLPTGSLPAYSIFNEQKVLYDKNAPSPGDGDALYKEIEKLFQ